MIWSRSGPKASHTLWSRRDASILALFLLLQATVAPGATQSQRPTRAERFLPERPVVLAERGEAPAVRALEAQTGAAWELRWDPWSGVAVRGVGGRPGGGERLDQAGILAAATAFREQHAALLGSRGVVLKRVRLRHAGRAWHVTWQQTHADRRVLRSLLDLTLTEQGRVVAFSSSLLPGLTAPSLEVDVAAARSRCEDLLGHALALEGSEPVVAVIPGAFGYRFAPAVALRLVTPHGWRGRAVVESGSGRVLEFVSLLRTEELSGRAHGPVHPDYRRDPAVDVEFPWLRVQLGFGASDPQTHADARGRFLFDYPPGNVTVRSPLAGLYVHVDNASSDRAPYFEREVAVPGEVDIEFSAAYARPDERTIYYHVNVIHDYAKERFAFDLLDFPVLAVAKVIDPNTGDPNYPNAYWNGVQMGFGNGGATFWNLGLFSDVVYHEYTHAITDYVYRPGGGLGGALGAAIGEALSDYFAATLNDEPLLGEHLFRRTPAPLRNLDNTLYWPDDRDARDEPHANGEILGGAFWDLREAVGAEVADAVIHFARELFPRTFEEYLEAMLLQDDLLHGDAWMANGSPHREAILTAFALHGIGPLAQRAIGIVHEPLLDTADVSAPRVVRTSLDVLLPPGAEQLIRLSYRTGEEFQHVVMLPQPDGSFAAEIPPMPLGARVHYYIMALRFQPLLLALAPDGAPQATFSYEVRPDEEAPRITRVSRSSVTSITWPMQVQARIEDGHGVANAFVEYTYNGERGATLGMARARTDRSLFRTRFAPVGGQPGDVVEYWIRAADHVGHETRFPESGTLRVELTETLEEAFEPGALAWAHEPVVVAQPDPWHLTTQLNHTLGGTQAWLCGSDAASYPAAVAAALVTEWYAIGAGSRATLWSWIDAEASGEMAPDGGRVEIQVEGSDEWTAIEPLAGYTHRVVADTNVLGPGSPCLSGRDPEWRLIQFDLEAWNGNRVRLRFLFGSAADATPGSGHGWALDDFRLLPGTPDPTDARPPHAMSRLLRQVGPNPFNPHVTFRLQVPVNAGVVTLDIIDARGRLTRRLLDTPLPAGPMRLEWDGSNGSGLASASGVYYYHLRSSLGLEKGKLVLLR
ncbi:MAG: hypothetical protein JSW67_11935 [Candidatus Latescibacterota bacterium]|nr:MAG: hypothetical protein JSW67_11935 [Candidatus Latescibacterota bacterium]